MLSSRFLPPETATCRGIRPRIQVPRLACLFLAALLALGSLSVQADQDGLRYPRNLSWRLVTEQEIQEVTGCPEEPGRAQEEADPLFDEPRLPLGGVEAVPNEKPMLTRPQSSWEVAPFPALEPPPPSDLPDEARKNWQERVQPQGLQPVVFADISTDVREAPAAALRPRPTALGQQLLAPEANLPRPFTLRRYHTRTRGFFQIALYGGTSGLTAERNFQTLRAAAPNRRTVEGLGESAFLSLIPREAPKEPAAEPEVPLQPTPDPSPQTAFEEIAFQGPVRYDLLDKGLIQARSAPAFQSIPVDLGLPDNLRPDNRSRAPEPGAASPSPGAQEVPEEPLDSPPPPRDPLRDPDPDPFGGSARIEEGGVQVLIAFFPRKGVVLELAMDDRVGDTQALMRLAFLVQARLLQRW